MLPHCLHTCLRRLQPRRRPLNLRLKVGALVVTCSITHHGVNELGGGEVQLSFVQLAVAQCEGEEPRLSQDVTVGKSVTFIENACVLQ